MTTKICPECAEEIDEMAKKCPRCHSSQSRLGLFFTSGVGTALVFIVLGVLFYGTLVKRMFPNVIYDTDSILAIMDSKHQFSGSTSNRQVAVVGTIQNFSDNALSEVYFHVKFLNLKGEVIDVISDMDFDFVVPPGAEIMFKARGRASAPENQYHSHMISVAKAEHDGLFPF